MKVCQLVIIKKYYFFIITSFFMLGKLIIVCPKGLISIGKMVLLLNSLAYGIGFM